MKNGSAADDGVVSGFGERLLTPLFEQMDLLGRRLADNGAIGLILIDATPLVAIERNYGAGPMSQVLETLAQRVRTRLAKDFKEEIVFAASILGGEHILLFMNLPDSDHKFYTRKLPRIAQDVRSYVAVCVKRIVYPYLDQAPEIPVGHGLALYRPFHRPEAQIRRLVEQTRATAQFELERVRRGRVAMLEEILLEENVSTV